MDSQPPSQLRLLHKHFVESCNSHYHQNPQFYNDTLQKIVNKLVEYSGIKLTVIIDSPLPAPALAHFPDIIRITPSVLTFNEDTLANILAHEWGHHVCKHVINQNPTDEERDENELEADRYSARFLAAHGYDLEKSLQFKKAVFGDLDEDEKNKVLENWRFAYNLELKNIKKSGLKL